MAYKKSMYLEYLNANIYLSLILSRLYIQRVLDRVGQDNQFNASVLSTPSTPLKKKQKKRKKTNKEKENHGNKRQLSYSRLTIPKILDDKITNK